jgi:hypothetical protein
MFWDYIIQVQILKSPILWVINSRLLDTQTLLDLSIILSYVMQIGNIQMMKYIILLVLGICLMSIIPLLLIKESKEDLVLSMSSILKRVNTYDIVLQDTVNLTVLIKFFLPLPLY